MIEEKAMKWLSKSWVVAMVLLAGCAGRDEFTPPDPNTAEYAPPVLDYTLPDAQPNKFIALI